METSFTSLRKPKEVLKFDGNQKSEFHGAWGEQKCTCSHGMIKNCKAAEFYTPSANTTKTILIDLYQETTIYKLDPRLFSNISTTKLLPFYDT